MGIPIPKVFVVNADGTGVKEVDFRNLFGADRDLSIAKFAWSPDGRKFVFRSQAGSKCNYMALGYKIETGHYPCIYSWNLSTADADGSHVSKAIASPDYEFGELFWIQ
jgi:Tol biopolymer transport system component